MSAQTSINPMVMALQQCQAGLENFRTNVSQGLASAFQQHKQAFKGAVLKRQAPKVVTPPRPAPFAAILPGDSVGEAVLTTGLLNFLQLYNSALVIRLVLTWFPNPPAFIEQPLATVTDPYLGLFRGIIPPIGGTLDLSPILAFVTLNFFTSSAAALPCEVGSEHNSERSSSRKQQQWGNPFSFLQPSRFEQSWAKRVQSQRAMKEAASDSTTSA